MWPSAPKLSDASWKKGLKRERHIRKMFTLSILKWNVKLLFEKQWPPNLYRSEQSTQRSDSNCRCRQAARGLLKRTWDVSLFAFNWSLILWYRTGFLIGCSAFWARDLKQEMRNGITLIPRRYMLLWRVQNSWNSTIFKWNRAETANSA